MRRWAFVHLSSATFALLVIDVSPRLMTFLFLANAAMGIRDLLHDEDSLW